MSTNKLTLMGRRPWLVRCDAPAEPWRSPFTVQGGHGTVRAGRSHRSQRFQDLAASVPRLGGNLLECAEAANTDTALRRHAVTPTRRYTDTPLHRHAVTPTRRYTPSRRHPVP